MEIRVIEKTTKEMEAKINSISTDLNKIIYMESALKTNLTYDIKRFLYDQLIELYIKKKMFDKAAILSSKKIAITTTQKEKIQEYIKSGELFIQAFRIFDAEYMFNRAILESPNYEKEKIKSILENSLTREAERLDSIGKKASSVQIYEHLLRIVSNPSEKIKIKEKLINKYKSLGKLSEAKALEK